MPTENRVWGLRRKAMKGMGTRTVEYNYGSQQYCTVRKKNSDTHSVNSSFKALTKNQAVTKYDRRVLQSLDSE